MAAECMIQACVGTRNLKQSSPPQLQHVAIMQLRKLYLISWTPLTNIQSTLLWLCQQGYNVSMYQGPVYIEWPNYVWEKRENPTNNKCPIKKNKLKLNWKSVKLNNLSTSLSMSSYGLLLSLTMFKRGISTWNHQPVMQPFTSFLLVFSKTWRIPSYLDSSFHYKEARTKVFSEALIWSTTTWVLFSSQPCQKHTGTSSTPVPLAPCLLTTTDTRGFSNGISLPVHTDFSPPNAATNTSGFFPLFCQLTPLPLPTEEASWQTVKDRFASSYPEASKHFKIVWLGEY